MWGSNREGHGGELLLYVCCWPEVKPCPLPSTSTSVCQPWSNISQKILPQWWCSLLNHTWFFTSSWTSRELSIRSATWIAPTESLRDSQTSPWSLKTRAFVCITLTQHYLPSSHNSSLCSENSTAFLAQSSKLLSQSSLRCLSQHIPWSGYQFLSKLGSTRTMVTWTAQPLPNSRQVDKWKRIKVSHIIPTCYKHLVFDKGSKNIHWRKRYQVLGNLDIRM